jgi:tetratricopeptide (TPR) repeat protein
VARARQQVSLGQYPEALASWETALEGDWLEDADGVRREIVDTCHARAVSLQLHEPEEAIGLLELALELVEDPKLQVTLRRSARFACHRGRRQAQQDFSPDRTGAHTRFQRVLDQAVRDLGRGAALGSQRAQDQLPAARKVRDEVGIGDVLKRANDAAGREDWDAAVRLLRQALQMAGPDAPEAVKKTSRSV